MSDLTKGVITDFVDYLMPELTPYESAAYVLLLRDSLLRDGSQHVCVGKRTIASRLGKGARGARTNYEHIGKVLKSLEGKGCLRIGETTRDGTSYDIVLPRDVPMVQDAIAASEPVDEEEDFFNDPDRRLLVFERDGWVCQYCGDAVTRDNATLDHYIPQSKGGNHSKANLRTSCLICNSLKSGKTNDEAAPLILRSMQERVMSPLS